MNMLSVMNNNDNYINTLMIPQQVHFIRYFLNLKANKSKHTAISYERDIKDFFNMDTENITIDDIRNVNIFDAQNFIMQLTKNGVSSSTINRKISALSSLYKWLLKYRDNKTESTVIKYNPFSSLKEEKPYINNVETEFLTEDEARKLLDSIDTSKILGLRNKAILALAITTALRKSEMINIKLSDITIVGGYDVVRVTRKGNKTDVVKLQAPVRHLIMQYIQETNRTKENNKDDYLFIGHSSNGLNGNKLDESTLNYMIDKATKRAGINKKLCVHSTRHTAITLVIMAGATAEKARDFAAHKNLATTNRYIHSVDKLKNNAGDLISIL